MKRLVIFVQLVCLLVSPALLRGAGVMAIPCWIESPEPADVAHQLKDAGPVRLADSIDWSADIEQGSR